MAEEPLACQARYLLEGSGLFEEMRGAGNLRKLALATEPLLCLSVQVEYRLVATTHDEQRRCPHMFQHRQGQVGTSSARDDGANIRVCFSGRPQGRGRSGARAEIADL